MVSFRIGQKVHSFKLSTGAMRMKKAGGFARAGLKHSGGVADRAEMVEGVANKVAGGLGTAATVAALSGAGVALPIIETEGLMSLTLALLGLGGMRSFEKSKGVQRNNMKR